MKKGIVFAAVLVAIISISLFLMRKKSSFYEYVIEGHTYLLLTAKNSSEWERGLMFYKDKKDLKGADGMIFIFPDREFRTFWNKNTYLDLDVYWIDEDKIINKSFLPSVLKSKETVTVDSHHRVDKVVEIIR